MSRKLKALILQHEEPTPPGYLAEWLQERDAEFDVHRIDLHEWTHDPRDYDFIASLGSEFAAFDDSKPFIRREADLLHAAASSSRSRDPRSRTRSIRPSFFNAATTASPTAHDSGAPSQVWPSVNFREPFAIASYTWSRHRTAPMAV